MKLTATGNRNNGTRIEEIVITGNLEEIVAEIETYMSDTDIMYSAPLNGGHVWFDDQETGFDVYGGDNALPVYEYGEEEGVTYYVHATPRPYDVETVKAYAKNILDAHHVTIEE